MRSSWIGGLLVVVALASAWPSSADAQRRRTRRAASRPSGAAVEADAAAGGQLDAEARGLFLAGREAFDAGRYDNALDYFTRAYALSGRPGLLFNIASTSERLRRDEEALRAYRAYLEAMPDAPNREYAQGRITFLEEQLRSASTREASVASATSPAPREPSRPAPPAVRTTTQTVVHDDVDGLEAPIAPGALAVGEDDRDRGGDVTDEAWFWTLIGIAVVGAGAGITAGVLASQSGSPDPAAPGDFGPGGVIVALEAP